jgi:6-phosphofructokinase 1
MILIPERAFDIEEVCERIRHRHRKGAGFSIVVVAEGAIPAEGTMVTVEAEVDQFGHARLGGIGNLLQSEIEGRTGFETRVTILGHIQRGGTPTAHDRVLATRFGVEAIDAADQGDFGKMVALQGAHIVRVPIDEAIKELKTVDPKIYEVASVFFG